MRETLSQCLSLTGHSVSMLCQMDCSMYRHEPGSSQSTPSPHSTKWLLNPNMPPCSPLALLEQELALCQSARWNHQGIEQRTCCSCP